MSINPGKLGGASRLRSAGRAGGFVGGRPARHTGRQGRDGSFLGRGNDLGAAARPKDNDDLVREGALLHLLESEGLAATRVTDEPTYSEFLEAYPSPIGGGEILFSGTDPVSPGDCQRWPDSPLCGGSVTDPGGIGFFRPSPVSIDFEVVANPTETLITVDGSLFGLNTPPLILGFRREGAEEIVENYWRQPPETVVDGFTQSWGNPGSTISWVYLTDQYRVESELAHFTPGRHINENHQNVVFSHDPPEFYSGTDRTFVRRWARLSSSIAGGYASWREWKSYGASSLPTNTAFFGFSWTQGPLRATHLRFSRPVPAGLNNNPSFPPYGEWRHVITRFDGDGNPFRSGERSARQGEHNTRIVAFPWNPPPPPPGPPPLPAYSPAQQQTEPPMSCNCKKIEKCLKELKERVDQIHERIGVEEFPVEVPSTIYGAEDSTVSHENIPEMISWMAQQIDAILGQYPIEIEQTNQLGETQMIELQNVAEALSELYGLAAQTSIDADYSRRGVISNIAETVAIKNAALITQDYVVANSEHLGYRGNPKIRKVRYSVNPMAETPLEFLQPFEGEVIGWEYEDKGTIKEDMMALRHSGGIVKSAFSRTASQLGQLGLDAIIKEFINQEDGWDDFIRRRRDPKDPSNLDQSPPRIIDRSRGNEE